MTADCIVQDFTVKSLVALYRQKNDDPNRALSGYILGISTFAPSFYVASITTLSIQLDVHHEYDPDGISRHDRHLSVPTSACVCH